MVGLSTNLYYCQRHQQQQRLLLVLRKDSRSRCHLCARFSTTSCARKKSVSPRDTDISGRGHLGTRTPRDTDVWLPHAFCTICILDSAYERNYAGHSLPPGGHTGTKPANTPGCVFLPKNEARLEWGYKNDCVTNHELSLQKQNQLHQSHQHHHHQLHTHTYTHGFIYLISSALFPHTSLKRLSSSSAGISSMSRVSARAALSSPSGSGMSTPTARSWT